MHHRSTSVRAAQPEPKDNDQQPTRGQDKSRRITRGTLAAAPASVGTHTWSKALTNNKIGPPTPTHHNKKSKHTATPTTRKKQKIASRQRLRQTDGATARAATRAMRRCRRVNKGPHCTPHSRGLRRTRNKRPKKKGTKAQGEANKKKSNKKGHQPKSTSTQKGAKSPIRKDPETNWRSQWNKGTERRQRERIKNPSLNSPA